MSDIIKTDICVIGGGSGGLSVAAGAVQMGASVVLIEKGEMGGDCLNTGCVPSKALLAAAKQAHHIGEGAPFGIDATLNGIDWQQVHDHVHSVIGGIAPHDSVERFEGLGVKVIQAAAKFTGPRTVEAGGKTVEAKWIVVATGSSAFVPPIPGVADVPYMTNETVFDRTDRPKKLLVIGGGPIGCELAQAHARLGSEVALFEMFSIMPKDQPDLVDVARQSLVKDGLELFEKTKVTGVEKTADGVAVLYEKDGKPGRIEGTDLLIAVGRVANTKGLDLEAAGIEYDRPGITVDARLRSTNKRVFAIGDVAGSYQFTHIAGYHAGIVIRNALFRLPAKVDYSAVPWVTYTDPEMAHTGLTEADAEKQGTDYKVLEFAYAENDRARAELATDGGIRVLVGRKGKILGASIVGKSAGELIHTWTLAISTGQKIGAMAGAIAPYPTLSELSKRAAGSYYTESLFGERMKKIVRFIMRFA